MGDERSIVSNLLGDAKEVIGFTVSNLPGLSPKVPKYTLELVESAWNDLQERGLFSHMKESLIGGDISPEVDNKLRDAGLTGRQLELKRHVFQTEFEQFKELAKQLEGKAREAIKDFWDNSGKTLLAIIRRLFHVINLILGSLASFIGDADAVQEFKGTLELLLPDK